MKTISECIREYGFNYNSTPGSRVKEHCHKYLELAYLRRGSMEHCINGQKVILHAGDYFIVDHGVSHSYTRISEERILVQNLIFIPSFLDRSLTGTSSFRGIMTSYLLRFCYQSLQSDPTGVTFHDDDGTIRTLLDSIADEYESTRYGYLEFIRCALVEILILTMRKVGSQGQPRAKSSVVTQMVNYIDNNYQQQVRLNVLAKELGYSAPYLSQKFSQEIGVSFMDYLHQVRIQKSCQLLETTDMKISQIAAEVGYDGVKYFNQIFRKKLSVTPREFRAIHK